jgi:hypothetical protein
VVDHPDGPDAVSQQAEASPKLAASASLALTNELDIRAMSMRQETSAFTKDPVEFSDGLADVDPDLIFGTVRDPLLYGRQADVFRAWVR